jgi:hypothetical protein
MADNVTANSGSGGATFATASGSWSGDTANFPGCFLAIVSGSEGSWTFAQVVGGAGAVAAGVQRMTLASDDPGVVALQIIDDWDESDRAKVNLIVGQAGIAAGAGAVGVTVPRFTLASDDPAVTALQILDNAISGSEMQVDVVAALPAGTNNIGDVDVLTVPSDPFGANADAASATGSISAKLRFIASTGIPITGTVTVGSHAVTNAGTFAVQVDGGALTALQLIDDVVYADDAAWTGDTSKHALVGGIYQSTPQTVTDGRTAPILLDANGKIVPATHAVTQSGTWNIGTVTTVTTVSAVTAISNALPAGTNNIGDVDVLSIAAGDNNIGNVDIATVPAPLSTTGGGAEATALRVTVASDSTGVLSVDDNGSSLTVDNGGTFAVQPQAATTGGASPLKVLDSDETEDEIKGTAGQLYSLYCFNSTNAILYVKLYNATAANVVVGTTTPVMTIPVPGNNDTDGAGVVLTWPNGLAFDTAITIATTTALADNDTGAPGANAMTLAGSYK